MNDKRIIQIALIVVLLGFLTRDWWYTPPVTAPDPPNIPAPEPEPQPEPDPVEPNMPDLVQYFQDWAATVRGDDSLILKDTDQWRTAFEQATQLLIGGTDYVAVEGRTEQIDFIVAESIGIDNRPLDATTRDSLAAALEEIAKTVVVDNPEMVIEDANYRPQIAITTAMYITPKPKVIKRMPKPLPLEIQWVGHAEAQRRSMAGEWVWVQLSGAGCILCEKLERNQFRTPEVIKASQSFVCCKIKDRGSEWNTRSYPTSVLLGPGWKKKQQGTTPDDVLKMLTFWKEMR